MLCNISNVVTATFQSTYFKRSHEETHGTLGRRSKIFHCNYLALFQSRLKYHMKAYTIPMSGYEKVLPICHTQYRHYGLHEIQCGFSPQWAHICLFSDNLDWIICYTGCTFQHHLWWLTVCFYRCVAGLNLFPQWSQTKHKIRCLKVFSPSMAIISGL